MSKRSRRRSPEERIADRLEREERVIERRSMTPEERMRENMRTFSFFKPLDPSEVQPTVKRDRGSA